MRFEGAGDGEEPQGEAEVAHTAFYYKLLELNEKIKNFKQLYDQGHPRASKEDDDQKEASNAQSKTKAALKKRKGGAKGSHSKTKNHHITYNSQPSSQNRSSHDNSSIKEHEATLMTHGTAGSPFPRRGKESLKTEEMNASFYSSKGSAGSKPGLRRSMHAIAKEIIQPKRATFPELLQQIEVFQAEKEVNLFFERDQKEKSSHKNSNLNLSQSSDPEPSKLDVPPEGKSYPRDIQDGEDVADQGSREPLVISN